MDKKTLGWGLCFVFGLVLIASFSIQHDHFFSGICGILGSICLVTGFIGLHWEKYQSGDVKFRRTVRLLIALCVVLVVLNIIAKVL